MRTYSGMIIESTNSIRYFFSDDKSAWQFAQDSVASGCVVSDYGIDSRRKTNNYYVDIRR